MPRSSREQTARHHEELIAAAAQLIRERGLDAVSLPDITGKIGLTRGAFYKHFQNRDELLATAVDACYREHLNKVEHLAAEHSDHPERAREALLDWYLSPEHRDDPGGGCPTSALAGAIAQAGPDSPLRRAFVEGVYNVLAANGADPASFGSEPGDQQRQVLTQMATLAGGVMMARAAAGDPLSDVILTVVRESLG